MSLTRTGTSVDPALAFDEFFESERPRLFRAMVLVTRDPVEADELTQEAFVRILERWDRVATMEDPRAYLYRAAMNVRRSAVRRAIVRAKHVVQPKDVRDPFEEVAAHDEAVRSLARLTPRQRAAVVVTELLGFPSEEAGRILGVRAGTVRSLTAQARAALLMEDDDA